MNADTIKKGALEFKRAIRLRNSRESLAGIIVAISFTKMGIEQDSLFESVACYEMALSGILICAYLNYYSLKKFKIRASSKPIDELIDYREALKQQITILGNIRYWYVMPIASGYFALSSYGLYEALHESRSITIYVMAIILMAVLSWAIIYSNENLAVKKLEKDLYSLPQ